MQSVADLLWPWFSRRRWHLGTVWVRPSFVSPTPDLLVLGYADGDVPCIFPIWLVEWVTPRVLETVDLFRRRWAEFEPAFPVRVGRCVPVVGALHWRDGAQAALQQTGVESLTPADVPLETLQALVETGGG